TPPREVPHIGVMLTPRQDPLSPQDSRYMIADVFDPSLMSLPNAHGFSSGAWRQKLETAQRNLGWNQQPAFLDAAAPSEPRSLLEPTPLDAAVLSAAEKTQALSEEPNDGEAAAPLVPVNQSVFRVLGPLERRVIVSAPTIPMVNNPMPLRPTQIRVGVGADGLVLYVLLDRSSGDDGVDAQALALAHQVRFEAEHDTGSISLTWGVLRFLWAMQPPTTTNVDSTAAQH
ncbi:MAG TPA: hypothetical protein VLZ30_12950, partial [Verrucomicrobiae bacterium]|nr:hypothetical protein [Verrucomicrobiae bacterium]